MDTNGRPIPVASVDDDPPGFPFTCTSEAELRSLFPGAEFVYLTPKSNNTTLSYDANVEREALAMLGKPSNPPTPTRTVAVATTTEGPLKGVEINGLGPRGRAEEFLKRLQTALQYASKKHEKKLKDQVEIIEELIREVF
jgi:hypothetical protein